MKSVGGIWVDKISNLGNNYSIFTTKTAQMFDLNQKSITYKNITDLSELSSQKLKP